MRPKALGKDEIRHARRLRKGCPATRPAPGDRDGSVGFPYKLVRHDGSVERLVDLSRDPGERTNLAERDPERVRALLARLAGESGPVAEPPVPEVGEVPPAWRDALRALGYVHGEE